jgi:MazG family protein
VDEGLAFDELCSLCGRLRAPDGCPWDRKQTLESLKAYILEEAYEVVDAISSADQGELCAELGDLLFQIIFAAQIAKENGWFDVVAVSRAVHAKMVQRHPHVFGDVEVSGAGEVVRNWEAIKARESRRAGALAGVPRQLPALLKALRITEKAAAVGFDWERANDVLGKLDEEIRELQDEISPPAGERHAGRVKEELGDVLFVVANLARRLGVDPEAALQSANEKFTRRFVAMEASASARGVSLDQLGMTELDALWEEAKAQERPRE